MSLVSLSLASLQLSNLQQQRIMVDQLRREAAIKRINVSQAIEDIKVSTIISSLGHQRSTCHFFPFFCCSNDIWLGAQKTRGKNHKMWSYSALILSTLVLFPLQKFISDHENEDYLLVGFPSQKSNPFREKSSCSVL